MKKGKRKKDVVYQVMKFPLGDLYFMRIGKLDTKGWSEMICPRCRKPLCDDPLQTLGMVDKKVKYEATFARIEKGGKEYKILCCSDDKKCKEAL